MNIKIGRIYRDKESGKLTRIFKDNRGNFYSGRGCTRGEKIPYNYYKAEKLKEPSLFEINQFLELELKNDFVKTINK